MTTDIRLPRSGQPDLRTSAQKAQRLAQLAAQIDEANDLDIIKHFIQLHPPIVGGFNLLVRVGAQHGYIHLLLRSTCRATSNFHFMRDLEDRLPELKESLTGIRSSEGRKEVLRALLKTGDPKFELAVRRTMWRALHEKDTLWSEGTCSCCLATVRRGFHERKHLVCYPCLPQWFEASGSYLSQQEVDRLWLGVYSAWVPDFKVEYEGDPIPKPHGFGILYRGPPIATPARPVYYQAATVKRLAIEVHGISIEAIEAATDEESQLELARNLCRFSAMLVCHRNPSMLTETDHGFILEWMLSLYGPTIFPSPKKHDVLSLSKLDREDIVKGLAAMDSQAPLKQQLLDLADGKDDEAIRKLRPSGLRKMLLEHHRSWLCEERLALFILNALKACDDRQLTAVESRIVAVVDSAMEHGRTAEETYAAVSHDLKAAAMAEFTRLPLQTKDADWVTWFNAVDACVPNEVVQPDYFDFDFGEVIQQKLKRLYDFEMASEGRLYSAADIVRLTLHCAAADRWYAMRTSRAFYKKEWVFWSTRHAAIRWAGLDQRDPFAKFSHHTNFLVRDGHWNNLRKKKYYTLEEAVPTEGLEMVLCDRRILIYKDKGHTRTDCGGSGSMGVIT